MDPSSDGVTGRFTGFAAIIATIAFLLAGVGAFYGESNQVNRNLDRNFEAIQQTCLAMRGLQGDLRFHLAEEAASEPHHSQPPNSIVAVDC